MTYMSKLQLLEESGGGVIDNHNAGNNAAAIKYIYDRSIEEVIQYEASPVNDLTSQFSPLALSFKTYVDSGLPMLLVLPFTREEFSAKDLQLPLVVRYKMAKNVKNITIKTATRSFSDQMAKLLDGSAVDFFSGDNDKRTRVSGHSDKNSGQVGINSVEYSEASLYFKSNFASLPEF